MRWRTATRSTSALHLALLVLITVVKSVIWIGLIPLFLVADEPAHFDNVQFRAEHHSPPFQNGKPRSANKVMHDGAAPEVKLLWESTLHKDHYRNPHSVKTLPERIAKLAETPSGRDTDGQATAMLYPGLYYDMAAVFYRPFKSSSVITRIASVRMLSLLFGLAAVIATYFAAMLVVSDPSLALVAALLVALQPMESQQTACVNNDAGVIGFAALLFYFQMRVLAALPGMPGVGTFVGLALSAAALVLTKPTGYGILPGSAVAVAAVVLTHYKERRVQVLVAIGAALTCAAAAYLASTGFSLSAELPGDISYPGPQGHDSFLAFLQDLDQPYLDYLLRSTWGQFGWLDYSLHANWLPRFRSVFALMQLGTIVAIVAFSLRRLDRPFWHRGPLFLFSIATVLGGVAFILYAEHRFRLIGLVGVIQGRNFLFVLPAFAIWAVVAIGSLVPARMRGLTAAMLFTGAVCVHAAAILTIVRQHYVR